MKQEYHLTISRTDRIWLIVFVSVLLAWELIKPLLPPPDTQFIESTWSAPDSTNTTNEKPAYSKKEKGSRYNDESYSSGYKARDDYHHQAPPEPIHLHDATWKDLRAIGFSSKVASNIERYMTAGGIIKDADQLLKIYGMDSMQLEAVSPYLIFPEVVKGESTFPKTDDKKPYNTTTIFDLNTVRVEELESLPGIGVVLAERIIKYRTSLGGFITVDQIKECYGLPPETFEKISPRLTIIEPHKPIAINAVDLSDLYHPYLNKKITGILRAYRTQHGQLKSVDDLKKVYPPDTTWCDKVLPYLEFD